MRCRISYSSSPLCKVWTGCGAKSNHSVWKTLGGRASDLAKVNCWVSGFEESGFWYEGLRVGAQSDYRRHLDGHASASRNESPRPRISTQAATHMAPVIWKATRQALRNGVPALLAPSYPVLRRRCHRGLRSLTLRGPHRHQRSVAGSRAPYKKICATYAKRKCLYARTEPRVGWILRTCIIRISQIASGKDPETVSGDSEGFASTGNATT